MSDYTEAGYENDSHDEFEDTYEPSYDEYEYEEYENLER